MLFCVSVRFWWINNRTSLFGTLFVKIYFIMFYYLLYCLNIITSIISAHNFILEPSRGHFRDFFHSAYFKWQGYTKMASRCRCLFHSNDHDAPQADKGRCKHFFIGAWIFVLLVVCFLGTYFIMKYLPKFMDLLAEIWLNGTVKNSVNYFYKIYRFITGVMFHSTKWDADLLLLMCIV